LSKIPNKKTPLKLQEYPAKVSRMGIGDKTFGGLTRLFTFVMVGLLIAFLVVLTIQAWPAIRQSGATFLWGTDWNQVTEEFGAAPAIFGTILSSLIALIFAVPISFGAAIYLVEIAPAWIRGPVSLLIELLAAIPSVIIGLWGLYVMVPFVRDNIENFLAKYLGGFPLFHPVNGNIFGFDFFSAGLILAIMIIPSSRLSAAMP
jgi:phosphate transport system permease protein